MIMDYNAVASCPRNNLLLESEIPFYGACFHLLITSLCISVSRNVCADGAEYGGTDYIDVPVGVGVYRNAMNMDLIAQRSPKDPHFLICRGVTLSCPKFKHV